MEDKRLALTPKGIALMEEVGRRCKERGITDPWQELDVIGEVMTEMDANPEKRDE